MPETDYPQGDGQPDCPECKGRGVIAEPGLIESSRPCSCVFVRDVARNVERGWRGLLAAKSIPSKLKDCVKENRRITASKNVFRGHFKYAAVRMPARWGFLVVTDADLMNAWLSPHLNVRDADISQMRELADVHQYATLVDLIEPPELLIVLCNVKTARNEAMPEVLLEVLNHRLHINKPTWVVDEPRYPLREGHISYSRGVGEFLSEWQRLELEDTSPGFGPLLPVSQSPLRQHVPLAYSPPAIKQEPEQEAQEYQGDYKGPSPHSNDTGSMLSDDDLVSKKKKAWGR